MKRIKAITQRLEYFEVPDDFELTNESIQTISPCLSILQGLQVQSITILEEIFKKELNKEKQSLDKESNESIQEIYTSEDTN